MRKLIIISILVNSVIHSYGQRTFAPSIDYKSEITKYTNLLKKFPDSADLYVSRAKLIFAIKPYREARTEHTLLTVDDMLNDMDKAIKLKTNQAEFYITRGDMRWKINRDTSGTFNDYTKAIELDSLNSELYNHRAGFLIEVKRKSEACNDFAKGANLGNENCVRGKEVWCD